MCAVGGTRENMGRQPALKLLSKSSSGRWATAWLPWLLWSGRGNRNLASLDWGSECFFGQVGHGHIPYATRGLGIRNVNQGILKIELRFLHREKLLIGAQAHFRHDDNNVLQVIGCAEFDSLLLSGGHVARIIHVVKGTKSLLWYKHVVETQFEATKEAFAWPSIPRHRVCCSRIFLRGRWWCSSISGRGVPTREPFC